MSGGHTPGPWTVNPSQLVKGPSGGTVADVRYKNGKHDARLIAASPDMLDALESAQALLNPMSGFVKRGDAKAQKHLEDRRDMIRAALAKAKGEAQEKDQ